MTEPLNVQANTTRRRYSIECNARHGTLTFKQALAKSCNSTFAQIAIELGPQKLADTAKELGLTSPVSLNNDIQSSTGRFFLEKVTLTIM